MYYFKFLIFFVIVQFSLYACTSPAPAHRVSSHKPAISKKRISKQKQHVISTAKNMLGIQYRYGGSSPKSGFDCSGLVYYSHKNAGITLPRTTSEQLRHSKRIYKSALRPGDLVFFAIDHVTVSHVGIYLGNNQFIHAPSTGKRVSITSIESHYWRSRFVAGGRI